MALVGHEAGITGNRISFVSLAFVLALTAVLMPLVDLDRLAQSIFDVSHTVG